MNRVFLRGRLGQDPELKHTTSGTSVCNFTVATSEFSKDKKTGDRVEKVEWHRIVCWGKTAEFTANHLKKGSNALIEGKLVTRAWKDKEGMQRYTTEVICFQIENLSFSGASKDQGSDQNQKAPESNNTAQSKEAAASSFCSDDIPF